MSSPDAAGTSQWSFPFNEEVRIGRTMPRLAEIDRLAVDAELTSSTTGARIERRRFIRSRMVMRE
jgi:hypothetical protein